MDFFVLFVIIIVLIVSCQFCRLSMTGLALLRVWWPLFIPSPVSLLFTICLVACLLPIMIDVAKSDLCFCFANQLPRRLLMDHQPRTGEVEELLHLTSFLAALELPRWIFYMICCVVSCSWTPNLIVYNQHIFLVLLIPTFFVQGCWESPPCFEWKIDWYGIPCSHRGCLCCWPHSEAGERSFLRWN